MQNGTLVFNRNSIAYDAYVLSYRTKILKKINRSIISWPVFIWTEKKHTPKTNCGEKRITGEKKIWNKRRNSTQKQYFNVSPDISSFFSYIQLILPFLPPYFCSFFLFFLVVVCICIFWLCTLYKYIEKNNTRNTFLLSTLFFLLWRRKKTILFLCAVSLKAFVRSFVWIFVAAFDFGQTSDVL